MSKLVVTQSDSQRCEHELLEPCFLLCTELIRRSFSAAGNVI